MGHRQTVQTQSRRRVLIRVSTVCLQNFQNEKYHSTSLKRKWTGPIEKNDNSIQLELVKAPTHDVHYYILTNIIDYVSKTANSAYPDKADPT